ncbi:MAG: IclR family transcriptional regulator, partial [Burkholderiales bacterium]|nr:IclR family transcriptional regulator [Burkholderiales bacterium]
APRFNLREICHPAMTRIAEATGDTVFLTQRSGLDAVCIDRHEGTFPIKTFTLEVGMRRPLGVGTGSLSILAALPEEEFRSIVASNEPRLQEHGLNGPTLLAQARKAQKLGYAVRETPTLAGVRSIGQALRNQSGVPFASLSISAISSRMADRRVQELATILRNESRLIERQIATGMDIR